MNRWYPLAVFYGLDWIKVSNDISNFEAPCETRIDRRVFRDIEREFTSPKVEFSYKGKRYFGYVPVHTVAVEHKSYFGINETFNEYNDDIMTESLREMIETFLQDYEETE